MRACAAVAAMCLLGAAPRALGQADAALAVERDAASADCPAAPALLERVRALRKDAALAAARYAVRFEREAGVYHARIAGGADGALVRTIESRAESCSAL